jgi:hypothetical protein
MSLKAVAINGSPITPTNNLTAAFNIAVGDVIECEVFGDWSPTGRKMKSWQVQIDGSGQGDTVPLMPAYWEYRTDVLCTNDGDCTGDEVCWWPEGPNGFCAGPNHAPEDAAFIDSMRADYAFAPAGSPPPEFKAVDLSTFSFRFASTLLQPNLAPAYAPPPKYLASYGVVVMPGAGGTHEVNLLSGGASFFVGTDSQIINPTLQGLSIYVEPVIQCLLPNALDPPDCAIDARQPSAPDGTSPAGWDSMTIEFLDDPATCDPCTLNATAFGVREVPFNLNPPTITGVTCDGMTATVQLSRIITEGSWTCIRYLETEEDFCMGNQPGDANGDRTSAPSDILRVIDCLNNVATCEIYQGDIDRSGVTGPPDILRVIDLLNGAGSYRSYLNTQISVVCP